ncbi:hypothetical protein JGC56_08490 [Salmonella enterica subsp. enterica serovar Saintpaul]|nr:hypothetical protein [Salmonella enterica subsp. enterica serovar Saintpaul]
MSDQTPIITHEPANIVLTIENGEVTASLETFLWMAERAGYTITSPAGEKDNGPDSDTNS